MLRGVKNRGNRQQKWNGPPYLCSHRGGDIGQQRYLDRVTQRHEGIYPPTLIATFLYWQLWRRHAKMQWNMLSWGLGSP